jgi:dihydrofolate reductase
MRNGTTFRFTSAAPHEVLEMATRAAGGQDVALGGGPAVIRRFLSAGLIDEMHLVIAPVLLGEGERIFGHGPAGISGYSCSGLTSSDGIAHAHITRTPEPGR